MKTPAIIACCLFIVLMCAQPSQACKVIHFTGVVSEINDNRYRIEITSPPGQSHTYIEINNNAYVNDPGLITIGDTVEFDVDKIYSPRDVYKVIK